MVCVIVCDMVNVCCVFVCVVLPGVLAYVRDSGVCGLRMRLWVVCKSCVMLYGVLLEWWLGFVSYVYVCFVCD